ncbi:Shedu immune nuclease family protein [Nocardia sp. NPDC050793]|uniref:Shedu immune nuclease family protein n=1 Tax=Nocardia sp. NPDC050793 TaxID=3155159 RepID=UPI0033E3A8BB
MARIVKMLPNQQKVRPHRWDKRVDCEWQVIQDPDGSSLLHLSTFGSNNRASHRKSSQSLQINPEIGAELSAILCRAFDLEPPIDGDREEGRLIAAYRRDPSLFRKLIENDEGARDVVAMAHRKQQVDRFRRLLKDDEYFDAQVAASPRVGEEGVWQRFFEENPWILGLSLGGQLLTSWDDNRLEQVVAGFSIAGVGKRIDALLRTAGRIRSLVFAEFKTHRAPLLRTTAYRPGCWVPSEHLSGAVAQVQGTVHRAVSTMGERLQDKATDGSDLPGEFTYLLRPRSYVVVGQLSGLVGEGGGDRQEKIRSFELFRRQLVEPEVITFDELYARAEWLVSSSLPS